MKKATGCAAQIVLLLTLACLAAVPLACIAALTAPIHTPQIAEKFACPATTHLKTEWYRASSDEPGEETLSITCVDAEGHSTPMLPQDAKMFLTGTWVYFPFLFIPLLVVGAAALAGLRLLLAAIRARRKQ